MSNQNKFFTTLNQPLSVEIYSLLNPDAVAQQYTTMEGVPLGTTNNAADGEIGLKVIQVGNNNNVIPGFEIPEYDEVVLTYYGSTNNIHTVTYKLASSTVAVLTLTYAASGAADNDRLTGVVKS